MYKTGYFRFFKVIKILPKFNRPATSPGVQRPQVGVDSLLGSDTTLAEKCQVKRSVIGKHCVLNDKCKVTNSLVMDHVRLGER